MYCGIGKRQLEILDTAENRERVIEKLYNEFKGYLGERDFGYVVLGRARTLLSTMELCDLLKCTEGDIISMLWNEASERILERVCKKFPRIREIKDACPSLSGDEYYAEWCIIYNSVFPSDIEDIVEWDEKYSFYCDVIEDKFRRYLSSEFFEGVGYSFDVRFEPIVNVKMEVKDPENLTEAERGMVIEEAIRQVREQFEDKISEENLGSIELYRGK